MLFENVAVIILVNGAHVVEGPLSVLGPLVHGTLGVGHGISMRES